MLFILEKSSRFIVNCIFINSIKTTFRSSLGFLRPNLSFICRIRAIRIIIWKWFVRLISSSPSTKIDYEKNSKTNYKCSNNANNGCPNDNRIDFIRTWSCGTCGESWTRSIYIHFIAFSGIADRPRAFTFANCLNFGFRGQWFLIQ